MSDSALSVLTIFSSLNLFDFITNICQRDRERERERERDREREREREIERERERGGGGRGLVNKINQQVKN